MSDVSREGVLKNFRGTSLAGRQREALLQALRIREFEIDLYWKRSAYFWAFIALAFAGYFSLQKGDTPRSGELALIVAGLGFIFSLGWYFVNRGSKAWQENWERAVDLLEDEIMGPLYKSDFKPQYSWRSLSKPFEYSPSKINLILAGIITIVWLFLGCWTFLISEWTCSSQHWVSGGTLVFVVVGAVLLHWRGQSDDEEDKKDDDAEEKIKPERPIYYKRRRYENWE